jgi:hypothetical protein
MQTQLIIGYDPGGNGAHGVAELVVHEGKAIRLATRTVDTMEDVVSFLDRQPSLAALGVDTLTCWSTGPSGWRPADRWLRVQYPMVKNCVVSPNSLFGSMGLNGMAVVIAAKQRFPDLFVTETHPKVLYWTLAQATYDYDGLKKAMDTALTSWLNIEVNINSEHEWDAAISALTAFAGSTGLWHHDLHTIPVGTRERLIEPCGPTHYSWPE